MGRWRALSPRARRGVYAGVALVLLAPVAAFAAFELPNYDPHPFRRIAPKRQLGVESLWVRGDEVLIFTRRGGGYKPEAIPSLGRVGLGGIGTQWFRIGNLLFSKGPVGCVLLTPGGKAEHDPKLVVGPRSLRFVDLKGDRIKCEW